MEPLPKRQGPPIKDLRGHRFGRLVVNSYAGRHACAKHIVWTCACDCGSVLNVTANNLRAGNTSSCGCFQREGAAIRHTTHGRSSTREYRVWRSMRDRCDNPNDANFSSYGGRGIAMCDRWRNSFEAFAADMGPRPSKPSATGLRSKYSVERIDNSKGYEPNNCEWATQTDQTNNTRKNVYVVIDGQRFSAAQAARAFAVPTYTVVRRIAKHGAMTMSGEAFVALCGRPHRVVA